jgi:hypothetical protein
MATLDDVTQKLKENNIENQLGHEGTRLELTKIGIRFDRFFSMMSMQKLKNLETQREAKKKLPAIPQPKSSTGGDSGFSLLGGLTGLGAIGATVAGIVASLTDLDAAIKALRIGQIAKRLNDTRKALNTRFTTFIDSIRDFGKGIATFGRNLKNLLIIPDETKTLFKNIPNNFLQGLYRILGLGVDGKPVVDTSEGVKSFSKTIQAIRTSISNFLKPVTDLFSNTEGEGRISKAVAPITEFFDGLSNKIGSITKYFPTVNFEALKGILGGGEAGGGIIGFFQKIISALDPILTPLKKIIGFALRPFFQIIISAIDFFVGFYEGFMEGDNKTLLDRIKSGIEGGIKGVIKGFTEAIDLLFIKLPAWFADKLGFEDASKKLKEFSLTALVDPAWEAVKNFFKEAFANPTSKIRQVTASVGSMSERLTKYILRNTLPDPNVERAWYDPTRLAVMGIPNSVYEYAGYTKNDKGKFVLKPDTNIRAEKYEGVQGLRSAVPPGPGGSAPIILAPSTSTSSTTNGFSLPGNAQSPVDASDMLLSH